MNIEYLLGVALNEMYCQYLITIEHQSLCTGFLLQKSARFFTDVFIETGEDNKRVLQIVSMLLGQQSNVNGEYRSLSSKSFLTSVLEEADYDSDKTKQ